MAIARKKILYVHHAGGFGGAPKSMGYIIKNLDRDKYDPQILNIVPGPINEFFKELPCKVTVIKEIRAFHGSYVVKSNLFWHLLSWFFLLPSIILAYKNIKKIRPDLIHLNSTCLFAFAIAAYFLKIKVVCHVREPIRKGWAGWPLRVFNKKFVSGFIAISQFDLDSLQLPKSYTKPREVIYNFVENYHDEAKPIYNEFRKELKISKDDILLLYLARFADSNGWKELIQMVKPLIAEHAHVHLALVGAKNEDDFIDTGSDHIHIVGFRPDISEILKTSDIFICPFVLPHFARGVIEAAAYSKPSIGAQIGGVNELIKDNKTGFLYDNQDEFINYCNLLIQNEELRAKMGLQALKFARTNFDPNKNLIRTYAFYANFF
tara:strand:+ start:14705 stop:15835 length:1131 start_codon:yes stop_codon:yes gene_type:complete